MNFEKVNKRLITFSSVALLFVGSLFYLVSVAFNTSETLNNRQVSREQVDDYFNY